MTRIGITDHAVQRYLERVKKLSPAAILSADLEAARAEILGQVAVAADHPGVLAIRRGPWLYPIRNGAVVTVHRACQPCLRTGRQRRERRDEE